MARARLALTFTLRLRIGACVHMKGSMHVYTLRLRIGAGALSRAAVSMAPQAAMAGPPPPWYWRVRRAAQAERSHRSYRAPAKTARLRKGKAGRRQGTRRDAAHEGGGAGRDTRRVA